MSPLDTIDLAGRRLERIDVELDRRYAIWSRLEQGGPVDIALALEQYAERPLEWMADWLFSYDPRNPDIGLPPYVPTRLTPVQEQWVQWVFDRRAAQEDGWAPKGRGVGASYMACAICMHGWLFEEGFSATLLSEKEESVDKLSDPSSLFQKLRIILEHLPRWMVPRGFDWDTHDNHRRLVNPASGSIITGVIGKNPGRGGRSTIAFVDEAAHIRNLTEARRALRDLSNCIIEISTYNGTGEPFYKSCKQADPEQVFKVTWRDLPELYDEAWYQRKVEQYADDPAGLAQEVDADPTAAVEDLCIPYKWAQACVGFVHPEQEHPSTPHVAGLDVGAGQALNVLAERQGIEVLPLLRRTEGNISLTAGWARQVCEQRRIEVLFYDGHGVGAGVGNALELEQLGFELQAFMAGASPSAKVWPNRKRSKERFANRKIEAWWCVRDRCRKTYETRQGIHVHPVEECLVLPDDEALLTQLSTPKVLARSNGKLILESKDQLARRGVASPDEADAVVMTEEQHLRGQWTFF